MYFCNDVELMTWEPGVFLEAAFGHQALIHEALGVVTGTALVMGADVLGNVMPGMVAAITQADGILTQLMEVAAVGDARHATISALRGRATETAIAPLAGGNVKVTVVSFRPQIAAVGDELLGLVGEASDRTTVEDAGGRLTGFRQATVYGVLAAIHRTLAAATEASNITLAKRDFYEGLWRESRRRVEMSLDADGDGIAEVRVQAGVVSLERV